MRANIFLHGSGSGSTGEKNPDPNPTLNRNKEKKIYLFFRQVGIKVDLINQHFKPDSGLYFVKDENNFITP